MGLHTAELKLLSESSFLPVVQAAMKQLYGAADAAILKQAQAAVDNGEQNRHFEAVQGLRIARHEISASFCLCLLSVFYHEAAACPVDRDSEHVTSLRNLMSIDIDALRADAAFAADLQDLQQRLAVIDQDIANPLAPDHFVDCFLHGLSAADIDIYTKMLVLRLFEEQLYGNLGQFVQLTNQAMAAQGVLPDLDTRSGHAAPPKASPVSEVTAGKTESAVTAEESLLQHALTDLQANDYEMLEELLSVEHVTSGANDLKVRDLVGELQSQKLISADLAGKARAQIEKMELVGRLFQLIISDQNLPPEARMLIAVLQLPYARIALSDADFLADTKHPAKVLLNEITRLCADWLPDRETLGSDALFRKLKATVEMFIETERLESLNYKELIFEFLALREVQRQKDLETAQRLVESQYGASSADVIREQVNQVLEAKLQGMTVPDSVVRLLREGWNHVLYLCALEKGQESEEWRQALLVIDELLETFHEPDTFSSRSEFLLKLPRLLKALRAGLTSIALPLELINELFAGLEQDHKQIVVRINGDLDDLVRVANWQPQEGDEALAATMANIHQVPGKKTGRKAAAKSAEVKPTPQVQAQPVADTRPQARVETKPEPKTKVKPESTAEVKPVQKAEARPPAAAEPKPAPRPEAKPAPQPPVKAAVAEKPPQPAPPAAKQPKEPVAPASAPEPAQSKVPETRSSLGQGASLLWNKPQGQVRCKIAAHIKPMRKYIITDRSGSKIAEIPEDQMEQMIARKEMETVDSGMIFDRALESVIGDIRGKR